MQHATLGALLLWAFGLTVSWAGLSAPGSHATLSADGKRLLVMISPAVDYDTRHPGAFSLPDGRSIILRTTFSKSGSYDSTTFAPQWQVDWFSLKYALRGSPDFTDVVRLNPFALDKDRLGHPSNWALQFYHKGKLVRSYGCQYLLTGRREPIYFRRSTWDYYLQWFDTFEVDKNHLFLSTARRQLDLPVYTLNLGLKESYTFDLFTGAVISRSVVGAGQVWWYCAAIALVFAVPPALRFLRRSQCRQASLRT